MSSSYKSYRKGLRDSLDPHLAVDPEDRGYLTDDLTADDDNFVRNLRKGNKKKKEPRPEKDLDRIERSVGEGLASVDQVRMAPKHFSRPSGDKVDIIAIDGSAGSDRAFLYAVNNLPKDRSLLLVHGVPTIWKRAGKEIRERYSSDLQELEERYEGLCRRAGRACEFKHFSYTGTTDFGDRVCQIAEKRGAASVIIGRRENVSSMRRALLGSSSQSVMNSCFTPVTVVGAATDNLRASGIEPSSDAFLG